MLFPKREQKGYRMRIIKIKTLKDFWEQYSDSENALKSWYKEVKSVDWKNFADIKKVYNSASCLKNNRVCFNICGNKYRLIVRINYEFSVVYIRFIGTHKEYDTINAEEI